MEVLLMDEAITQKETQKAEEPKILEEIVVEELGIDGVCGVY
jgi:mycofactocin precursor